MDLRVFGSGAPKKSTPPQSGRFHLTKNVHHKTHKLATKHPMTGKTNHKHEERMHHRPAEVPSLDLRYLQETENKTKPFSGFYPYDLTPSPASVSTIDCEQNANDSVYDNKLWKYFSDSMCGPHPDVPSLGLDLKESPEIPVQVKNNVWDDAVVPEDLPGPSIKYQDMYKQYKEEMRDSYRNKGQMKNPKKADHRANGDQKLINEDSILEQSLAQLKISGPNFVENKMEAELSENKKKKEKLIETVMIDQLSRSVICDPEQNKYSSEPHTYVAHQPRGANRFLHESSIQTQGSSTENLLSKRVRFGVRILTRNSHDALRELIGFFFFIDNSLTIYEFRQFGKNSKALPFIKKGEYSTGESNQANPISYTLCDIYPGSNLILSVEKQSSLPETLRKKRKVVFRVTDVAEKEKSEILLSGVRLSDQPQVYNQMHWPRNKADKQKTILLAGIQRIVREKLKKRGIRTVTGLGQHYRKICQLSASDDGCLLKSDLEKGLKEFHIDLPQNSLDELFVAIKEKDETTVDYYFYMFAVIGEMNEYRKAFVRKTFQKMGGGNQKGSIPIGEMRKFYHSGNATKVMAGGSSYDAFELMLGVCQKSTKDNERMEYLEWEEYYEGLSIGIETDQEFVNVFKNLWSV